MTGRKGAFAPRVRDAWQVLRGRAFVHRPTKAGQEVAVELARQATLHGMPVADFLSVSLSSLRSGGVQERGGG